MVNIRVLELNKEKLANILMRVPLSSMQGGHKKISSTIKDYFLPSEDSLEAQFVRDLFVLETDEIIDKWYDGKENAAGLLFHK